MAKTSSLVGGIILALLLASCGADAVGDKYVSFAKCLYQKNVKMYGSYTCPHCLNQKKAFGELGFKEINYIECNPRGPNQQAELCLKEGIEFYPTWTFPDNSRLTGELAMEQLAEKSGCVLPLDKPL